MVVPFPFVEMRLAEGLTRLSRGETTAAA